MPYNASPIALASPIPISPPTLAPLFGVQIGPDTSGSFAMSASGLAVQRSDGRWVSKPRDEQRLLDVTDFLLPGINPMVYFLPVECLERGDLTVISNDPLTLRYVVERTEEGEFEVLDPDTGDVTDFIPLQVPLFNFFVRVVSLLDFFPDFNLLGKIPEAHRGLEEQMRFFRERGRGEARMGEGRERFEMDEFLMISLLSQGSSSTTNLLPLLFLSRAGRGESGLLAALALSGALPQLAPTTAPPTTAVPAVTPAPPAANNALLLAMLLGGGLGRRRWHDDDDRGEEANRAEKREPEKRE